MKELCWQYEAATLHVTGCLEKQTLNVLWEQRKAVFKGIKWINTAHVSRLDSAGLALLVHCCLTFQVKLVGVKPQQAMLIKLYHLQHVME